MTNYESYCNREIRLKFNSIDPSMEADKENEADYDNEVYRKYMELMEMKRNKYHRRADSEEALKVAS